MTYWSPDERSIGDGIDDSKRASLLLLRLTTCAGHPAQDDGVHRVCANSEHAHGEIARASVQCGGSEHETKDRDDFGCGDMPRALVEPARLVGPVDRDDACDEVGWAGENTAGNISLDSSGMIERQTYSVMV